MISREDLFNRILYLAPNAKFSFWPDDGSRDNVDMGCQSPNPIKMAGFCIDWRKENTVPCPTWEQIQAVDQNKLSAKLLADKKSQRDKKYAKDLSIVAAYNSAKKGNDKLTFTDYIDQLEAQASALSQN